MPNGVLPPSAREIWKRMVSAYLEWKHIFGVDEAPASQSLPRLAQAASWLKPPDCDNLNRRSAFGVSSRTALLPCAHNMDPVDREKYQALRQRAGSALLSELLPELVLLGQQTKNSPLVKWASLELGGYFKGNSALTDEVVVPEYRIVVGQYFDRFGRPLVITESRWSFINEYRLRYGVVELERMEHHTGLLSIEDPTFTEMLREQLQVEVQQFSFSPTSIAGVFGGIRTRLIEWIGDLESTVTANYDRKSRATNPRTAQTTLRPISPTGTATD
jgi:hypothetical protein